MDAMNASPIKTNANRACKLFNTSLSIHPLIYSITGAYIWMVEVKTVMKQ